MNIPDRYKFADKVPREGASCATCYYVAKDGEHCRNKIYAEKMGSDKLGAATNRWCCALWSATKVGKS